MPSTREVKQSDRGPWRAVAYIGVHNGARGGRAWRLVLDECGHIEWRKQPTVNPYRAPVTRKIITAPHRVRCTSCAAGVQPWNVGESVALAQRIDEGS